ncbi:serine hydrolase FSH [Aspergillus spectabilis]
MHFLCLHGVGTNSKVLELQTSAIRYALGPQHTYDFVEGALDHPMAPGISNLVSPTDTFHAYFAPTSGLSMLSALRDLDSLIAEADPSYDGVLGFSHGSCLAATLLLHPPQARAHHSTFATLFKVAVFFSAGTAADYAALQADEVKMLQQTQAPGGRATTTIDIPTVHVFAENDEIAPGQGDLLVGLCSTKGRHVATHRLGHRIPGAAERNDLDNAVKVIKEAIRDAEAREKESRY